MLGPELDLEADLSIDSIKRIEIIGEVAERIGLPGAAGGGVDESMVEELAQLKTLGGIVDWIAARRPRRRPSRRRGRLRGPVRRRCWVVMRCWRRWWTSWRSGRVTPRTCWARSWTWRPTCRSIRSSGSRSSVTWPSGSACPGRRAVGVDESMVEELAQLKTLAGIVDWIASAASAASAAAPAVAAPAGAGAAPVLGRDALLAALVDIVAERTGYPTDMLGPELDLEADLSIDSIKRVEIIGDVAERIGLPGAAGGRVDESMVEELAQLKTLAGIVDWIAAAADRRGRRPRGRGRRRRPSRWPPPSPTAWPTGARALAALRRRGRRRPGRRPAPRRLWPAPAWSSPTTGRAWPPSWPAGWPAPAPSSPGWVTTSCWPRSATAATPRRSPVPGCSARPTGSSTWRWPPGGRPGRFAALAPGALGPRPLAGLRHAASRRRAARGRRRRRARRRARRRGRPGPAARPGCCGRWPTRCPTGWSATSPSIPPPPRPTSPPPVVDELGQPGPLDVAHVGEPPPRPARRP